MSQNLSLPDLIQQGQLPHSEEKNVVSQINRYNRWLLESDRLLYQPDLEAYRDHLLGSRLKPLSVKVHLSNSRHSYKVLVNSLVHRQALIAYLGAQFPDEDFATIKAKADELELRLTRATDPKRSRVTTQTV